MSRESYLKRRAALKEKYRASQTILGVPVSTRTWNAVHNHFGTFESFDKPRREISLDEFAAVPEARWLRVPSVGRKSLAELKGVLATHGRTMPGSLNRDVNHYLISESDLRTVIREVMHELPLHPSEYPGGHHY